jgi:hypothetical protein
MGYRLRMPAQLGDWLAELQGSEPVAAAQVGAAIVALLDAAELPGPPLVTGPSSPLPPDPRETLDCIYQDLLERLQRIRRGVADVATEARRAELRLDELRAEPDHDPAELAALEREVADAQHREEELTKRSRRLQARVDAFRIQKETIKASYTAAVAQALSREAAAELDRVLAQADRIWPEASPVRTDSTAADEHQAEPSGYESVSRYAMPGPGSAPPHGPAAPAGPAQDADLSTRLRDQPVADDAKQSPPLAEHDVLELNADPFGADVRILFAIEPEGAVTLLTVLEGPAVIRDSLQEATHLAGELLAELRAEGSPLAADEADDDWLEFAGAAPFLQSLFADTSIAVAERAIAVAAAESLAGLRGRRGMSRAELARASGISQWRLSMIEPNGLRSADLPEVAAYIRALGGRLELTASLDGQRTPLA